MNKGISILTTEEKTMVNNFMVNIKRANMDTEIKYIKAKRDKGFLRVTVMRGFTEEWYHVLPNGEWY